MKLAQSSCYLDCGHFFKLNVFFAIFLWRGGVCKVNLSSTETDLFALSPALHGWGTSPADSLRPREVGQVLALAQRISPAAHACTVGAVNKFGAHTSKYMCVLMAGEEKYGRRCGRHRRQNAENDPGSTACAGLQPHVIPQCDSPASGDVHLMAQAPRAGCWCFLSTCSGSNPPVSSHLILPWSIWVHRRCETPTRPASSWPLLTLALHIKDETINNSLYSIEQALPEVCGLGG